MMENSGIKHQIAAIYRELKDSKGDYQAIKGYVSDAVTRYDFLTKESSREHIIIAYHAIGSVIDFFNTDKLAHEGVSKVIEKKRFQYMLHLSADALVEQTLFKMKDLIVSWQKKDESTEMIKALNILTNKIKAPDNTTVSYNKYISKISDFSAWLNDDPDNGHFIDTYNANIKDVKPFMREETEVIKGYGKHSEGKFDKDANFQSSKRRDHMLPLSGRDQRRARFRDISNINDFIMTYMEFSKKPGDVLSNLAEFHTNAIERVVNGSETFHVWEWFRGAGKSIIASIYIPLWMVLHGKLSVMILSSHSQEKAQVLSKGLMDVIKNNKGIEQDYGKVKIEGTHKSSCVQYTFDDGRTLTVYSYGISQSPVGVRDGFSRPSLIVVDDAEDPDQKDNHAIVQKKLKAMLGPLRGCFGAENKIIKNNMIYCNNRLTRGGLTETFVNFIEEKNYDIGGRVYYEQVCLSHDPVTKAGATPDEGGVSSWPEQYSDEDIRIKMSGNDHNMLQQMYHRWQPDDLIYNKNWIKFIDIHKLTEISQIVVFLDPAYSLQQSACKSSIMVMGLYAKDSIDQDGEKFIGQGLVVLDIWTDRVEIPDLVHKHLEMAYEIRKRLEDEFVNEHNEMPVEAITEGVVGQENRLLPTYLSDSPLL